MRQGPFTPIIEYKLLMQSQGGAPAPVVVQLGAPYLEKDDLGEQWWCPLHLPSDDHPVRVAGEDALQAMELALQHVKHDLNRRHARFKYLYENGEPYLDDEAAV